MTTGQQTYLRVLGWLLGLMFVIAVAALALLAGDEVSFVAIAVFGGLLVIPALIDTSHLLQLNKQRRRENERKDTV